MFDVRLVKFENCSVPTLFCVQVIGLEVRVEDAPLESSVLRFKKFQREYISKTDEYNEHLITTHLVSLQDYRPLLLRLKIEELTLVDDALFPPAQDAAELSRKVSRFVDSVRAAEPPNPTSKNDCFEATQYYRVEGAFRRLVVRKCEACIRDIPAPILTVDLLHLQVKQLELRHVASSHLRSSSPCSATSMRRSGTPPPTSSWTPSCRGCTSGWA